MLEYNPSNPYNPASDAGESDPEQSKKMLNPFVRLTDMDAKCLLGHVPNSKLEQTLINLIKQTEWFGALGFAEGQNRSAHAACSAQLLATKRLADREWMND